MLVRPKDQVIQNGVSKSLGLGSQALLGSGSDPAIWRIG